MTFIFVALGGAVGACGRYAISLIPPVKSQFPILTLITNLLGALLIGFIVGIAESRNGFTTFSTFRQEAYSILSTRNYGLCGLYVILSVVGCITGVWCGKKLAALV